MTQGCNNSVPSEEGRFQQLPKNRNVDSPTSARHDMAILFTCTVCDTRSAKSMSKNSYENGVVIVRCPSCKNLHLIADRLGWLGEPGTVESFLAEKGIEVRKGDEGSYEFSIEDLNGWSSNKK